MGFFTRTHEPPDIERLKAKQDVKGLLQALTYGDRRKRETNEDFKQISAEVCSIEIAAASALADLHEPAAARFIERILVDHGPEYHPWITPFPRAGDRLNLHDPYALTLAKFGESAVTPLMQVLLKQKRPDDVTRAAVALGHIGPAAKRAVPDLLTIAAGIYTYDSDSVEAAVWALGCITNAPEVIPVMIQALQQGSVEVFSKPANRAVQALGSGRYGKDAADALASLLQGQTKLLTKPYYEAMLSLCLMGDPRGLEAFLLPANFSNPPNSIWMGRGEFLAIVGRFRDERVSKVLRSELHHHIAQWKKGLEVGSDVTTLLGLKNAVYAALGLAAQQDLEGATFLLETLATQDIKDFRDWVTDQGQETLALGALSNLGAIGAEALKALRARLGDAVVEDSFAQCAAHGKVDVLRLLLGWGASPGWHCKDGNPALSVAALNNRLEVVRLLLQAGSKVNDAPPGEFTPFMCACGGGHLELARVLLAAGADPKARDGKGLTALKIASALGKQDIIQFLHSAGVRE